MDKVTGNKTLDTYMEYVQYHRDASNYHQDNVKQYCGLMRDHVKPIVDNMCAEWSYEGNTVKDIVCDLEFQCGCMTTQWNPCLCIDHYTDPEGITRCLLYEQCPKELYEALVDLSKHISAAVGLPCTVIECDYVLKDIRAQREAGLWDDM